MWRSAAAATFVLFATACVSDRADDAEVADRTTISDDESTTTRSPDAPVDDDLSDTASGDEQTDGSTGTDEPAAPEPARDAGPVEGPPGVRPDEFTTVTVRVTASDGAVCDVCLWLADTGEERARGLMGVTDLGAPVGMLFRFDRPTNGNFFMFATPMPLSIAWFDSTGAYVGETDMAPCVVDDSSECRRYAPGGDYVSAIEMVQGELGVIGIGPGSTVEILEEHETCPTNG